MRATIGGKPFFVCFYVQEYLSSTDFGLVSCRFISWDILNKKNCSELDLFHTFVSSKV